MFLRKIAGKIALGVDKNKKPTIIDFTNNVIILPNGDIVDRNDIIAYENGQLVYRAPDGTLKTYKILGDKEIIKQLGKPEEKKEQVELFI